MPSVGLEPFCAVFAERDAGRGGLGAVMGSKNLKAIAVAGGVETAPAYADRDKVGQLLKEINQANAAEEGAEYGNANLEGPLHR